MCVLMRALPGDAVCLRTIHNDGRAHTMVVEDLDLHLEFSTGSPWAFLHGAREMDISGLQK